MLGSSSVGRRNETTGFEATPRYGDGKFADDGMLFAEEFRRNRHESARFLLRIEPRACDRNERHASPIFFVLVNRSVFVDENGILGSTCPAIARFAHV